MSSIILAAPIGILIGLVMGSLGGGGAVLLVPILVYGFGLIPHAASTAALIIVGVGALGGIAVHHRLGNVRWRAGLTFAAVGAPAAWFAAKVAGGIDPRAVMIGFAALLAIVALLMFFPRTLPRASERRSGWELTCWGLGIGLLTGFFGVGGGFIIVPALVLFHGFTMPVATGTSLFVIASNAAIALGARATDGIALDWRLTAVFCICALVGNLAGAQLSRRLESVSLQRAFAFLLVGVAVYVLVRQ